jgi:hypothetical protein
MNILIIDFSGTNHIKEMISKDVELFAEIKTVGMPNLLLINNSNIPEHTLKVNAAL